MNKEYIVDGQFCPDGIEIKVQSREEGILRELGIVHLGNKVTRSRTKDETDATILKQAGISYINTTEDEKKASKDHKEKKREMKDKLNMKPLSRTEVEILRKAGVTWLDNMAVINGDDDTYCHKLACGTSMTATDTFGDGSTVNSTYAERELMRRLKHGWSSTGEDCGECGMPVICKSKKGSLLECVICGVIGGEDNYDCHEEEAMMDGGQGVINLGTNMSNMSPNAEANERFSKEKYDYQTHHCHECQTALLEGDTIMGYDECMYCGDCAEKIFEPACSKKEEANQDELDVSYNEALGRRLFEGWELTTSNCPSCNGPLISEFQGAPIICLRCG